MSGAAEGMVAGSSITIKVAVATEDGQQLPWDVVSSSLSVTLLQPGGCVASV